MAFDPKPIKLTSVDEEDYTSTYEPEEYAVVGGLPVSEAVQAIATVGTADATDEATAIALANALKARLNQLITALKS
jgi:hypothetical protein